MVGSDVQLDEVRFGDPQAIHRGDFDTYDLNGAALDGSFAIEADFGTCSYQGFAAVR